MVSSAETSPILVKQHIFWYNLGFPKPLKGNQVRHILIITIIILVFLVSYFLSISLEIKEQVTVTLPNGTKYVGEWKDGEQNGQGTSTFSDGRKYEGEFKYGVFHGQGTLTYPNGDKYVGEWKDGFPNGQGTETYPNGGKYVGSWKGGLKWNGTYYDQNGNITGKYVNGEWIKQ